MAKKTHPVEHELDQRLRVWRRGLAFALALRVGAWLLLALAVTALYDLFLPLPENARFIIGLGLPLSAIGVFLFKFVPIRRIGRREMAIIADTLLADPHRSLLSAYELIQSGPAGFLKGKAIADAQLGLFDLPVAGCRPRKVLRAAKIVTGAILGTVFLLILLKPQSVPTLAVRLLAPFADIPPYSALNFKISPAKAQAIYGGDLEVSAQITGGEVNVPVRVITRYEGETEESECFRGMENLFSQKLEKIVRPVEFCFAAGSARSTWHKVRLLLEPRFSLARLTISPPAYTHEAVREIVLGREEIRAIRGATASLSITSNRPLAGGEMKIKPLATHGEEKSLPATPTGVHTLRFDWPMLESATLQVQLRDVQGTAAPAPLEIKQTVLPDEKPRLTLHEPGAHSLATPRTLVPVSGSAQDDFGLRRVDFIRTLKGFRERPEELAVPKGDKAYKFHTQLDLATLGVEPGQVIELYIEGRDENPSLTGIQTSDVSRVEIISEEEYAKMLRERISLDELLARFQQIQEQLARVRQALASAQEATKEGKPDALKKSTETVRDAASKLDKLSRDFPAFEIEQAMEKALGESATRTRTAAERLGQLQPSQPDVDKQIEAIRKQFDGETAELDGRLAQRPEIEAVGHLFEQAASFMQLVQQQRELANWIDRMALTGSSDAGALSAAAKLQDQLREVARQMPGQMRDASKAIPNGAGYDKLKADADAFAAQLEESEAQTSMARASTAAQNTDAQKAAQSARQAHEQLAALVPDASKNEFAEACNGSCQKLFPQGHSLGKTLGQCLGGMMSRARLGALGSGGPADDGYATQGFSGLELPVFGPQRSRITPPPRPVITSLGSIREGLSKTLQLNVDNQARIEKPGSDATGSASISLQQIPEKYRSAVRKYFSNPPAKP